MASTTEQERMRPFDLLYRLRDFLYHAENCPDNGYAAGGGAACDCGLDDAWFAARTLEDRLAVLRTLEEERDVLIAIAASTPEKHPWVASARRLLDALATPTGEPRA